ncbi:MAG: iron-sulfur cluster assembly accessory protein [Deltaproteobacteria bacterium]|nr:iron-sulfur cluster assembly accessory protein [Deltaproteobacteria bacterium]MCL5277288.1 iron-sulfur cluster assembly accessory protein [Deltaproteobacteria bacterium]
MLTLTDRALERFKKILKDEGCESFGIRIFMTDSGCCGPSLALDLVERAADGDVTIDQNGLKVFVEKDANETLAAATMDFSDQRGFVLNGMPKTGQDSCCS